MQFLAAEAEASAIAALVKAEQLARAPIQQPKAQQAEPLVTAARAQGADQGALVDRNERRAESPHRKAEQKQAKASREPHAPGLVEAAAEAQAEVRAQHLPAFLGVAAAVSLDYYRKRQPTSSTVLHGREGVTAAHESRLNVATGVDDSGQLSITAVFLVHSRSAPARLWQQEPREGVDDIVDWELSCPRFRSLVVVPVSCFSGKDSERNTASKFRSLWSLNHAVGRNHAWSGFIR